MHVGYRCQQETHQKMRERAWTFLRDRTRIHTTKYEKFTQISS